jgi:hypothetical protein
VDVVGDMKSDKLRDMEESEESEESDGDVDGLSETRRKELTKIILLV